MLLKGLHTLNHYVDRIYMFVAASLFVILISASSVQVFTRYIMNASLVGTEELARYCFIWMSLLGGSIAVGKWVHTSISVIYDVLPKVPKKLVFCVQNILIITLSLIFITGGITMMTVSSGQLTPSLHFPKSLIYLVVPVCGVGMLLHAIEHILRTVTNFSAEGSPEKMEVASK